MSNVLLQPVVKCKKWWFDGTEQRGKPRGTWRRSVEQLELSSDLVLNSLLLKGVRSKEEEKKKFQSHGIMSRY